MAASYQAFAHRSETLGGDPVVTKPTGTVDGDLLIAIGILSGAGTITKPDASWNTHANSQGAGAPLFWKIASGEPANYTFAVSSTFTSQILIVRVSGADLTTPIDVASGLVVASGTAAIVIPSVTPSGANNLLLQLCVKLQNTTYTPPGTAAERFDATSATQSAVSAGGDEIVGAGATGTRTWTAAATGGFSVGYMLAINPAPPGSGSFTGTYDFSGSAFTGEAGPGVGSFTGGYDFSGAGFDGEAGPGVGSFSGGYDFSGSAFVGSAAGGVGVFLGGYDFSGSDFTGVAPPPGGDYLFTPGGRDRFTVRRTPKNRRRSR
jgi:hypothetical protein